MDAEDATASPEPSQVASRADARQGRYQYIQSSSRRLTLFIFAAAAVVFAAVLPYSQRPPEIAPFSASKLTKLDQFSGQHAQDLLWSTYRPGQYFGMRMRTPKSLLAGLMWFDPQTTENIRHNAQERDGLSKYGWEAHDGRSFGRQELYDRDVHLTTSWAKRQCLGCGNGGDWAVKLNAEQNLQSSSPHDEKDSSSSESQPQRLSVLFYVADEEERGLEIHDDGHKAQSNEEEAALVSSGQHPIAGDWQMHITSSSQAKLRHLGTKSPDMHNLTDLVQQSLVLRRPKGQRVVLPTSFQTHTQQMPMEPSFS